MKVIPHIHGASPIPDRAVAARDTAEAVRYQGQEEKHKQQPHSREEADGLAQKMNAAAELFNKAVEFKVFEGNRIIIRVIDKSTDEVLTEFPPERLLEALRSMERSLGVLIDERV